jgi:TPR repeat protein
MCWMTLFRIKRIKKKLSKMQQFRQSHDVDDAKIQNEIKYELKLHDLYQKLIGKKKHPFAQMLAVESWRAAAQLNHVPSMYELGNFYLKMAQCRENLEQEKIFSSAENQRAMKDAYLQAHTFLEAAQKMGHLDAMLLYGLCFIFGWGMPIDQNKGYQLVIESIDKKQCWGKLPQLFAPMGLNKSEFFEALIKRQSLR